MRLGGIGYPPITGFLATVAGRTSYLGAERVSKIGADGVVMLRHSSTGPDPEELGRSVAHYLLHDAGGADLAEWSPLPAREQR